MDRSWFRLVVTDPSNRFNWYDRIIPFGRAGGDHSTSTVVAFKRDRVGAARPSGAAKREKCHSI